MLTEIRESLGYRTVVDESNVNYSSFSYSNSFILVLPFSLFLCCNYVLSQTTETNVHYCQYYVLLQMAKRVFAKSLK